MATPPVDRRDRWYLDAKARGEYVKVVPTVIHGDFEWDTDKALASATKHGVTFAEAACAMIDPMAVDFDDVEHPDRLITLATSPKGRILHVVTTESGPRTRIISLPRNES